MEKHPEEGRRERHGDPRTAVQASSHLPGATHASTPLQRSPGESWAAAGLSFLTMRHNPSGLSALDRSSETFPLLYCSKLRPSPPPRQLR